MSEIKKRVPRLAAEYAEERGPFSHAVIYGLYQKLELVRKAANGRRRRSDGWKERYLSAAYCLVLDWRDARCSCRMTSEAARMYEVPMKGDPIEVIIQATAPFWMTFDERKSMLGTLLRAQDNNVLRDQLTAFLE